MRNTFEGFIVNDSNRDAFEFANKVAKQETIEDNPLLISGPHGCGKSHLIDGIWHYYVCADNGKHPEWISSFALTERFKNFTQGKNQFADKFNELDLLLFDDIDLVDDKCNGELLSQVIDELIKRGKQICVASTKPLDELSPTLKDVFSKGKCVTVSLPTKEEQKDFYKQLSKRESISLHGEEPYDYLCEKQKDYRTMKAEFIKLKYNMILENCETASLGVGAVKRYLAIQNNQEDNAKVITLTSVDEKKAAFKKELQKLNITLHSDDELDYLVSLNLVDSLQVTAICTRLSFYLSLFGNENTVIDKTFIQKALEGCLENLEN